jgi:Tfp pilus assembly protein PilN
MKAVNLLPSELRGASPAPAKRAVEPDSGGSGSYVVLGALALSVAALAGWVLTGNTIEQRKADLASVAERSQAAQARAASLKPYADFATVAAERVATVQQLADSRFRWKQALRDVSLALPTDVSVKKLNASIATGAGGSSPLRGAITAPAIELSACAPDQKAVARTLARLRAVNGVTRVSLSRSARSEATVQDPAVPIVGVGDQPKPEGCAGKNPPDFEAVMFFETHAALSAEPTLTAAAAPTPAAGQAGPAPAAGDPAATATPAPASADTATPVATEGATP